MAQKKVLTTRLPESLIKRLRIKAINTDRSVEDLLAEAVEVSLRDPGKRAEQSR